MSLRDEMMAAVRAHEPYPVRFRSGGFQWKCDPCGILQPAASYPDADDGAAGHEADAYLAVVAGELEQLAELRRRVEAIATSAEKAAADLHEIPGQLAAHTCRAYQVTAAGLRQALDDTKGVDHG